MESLERLFIHCACFVRVDQLKFELPLILVFFLVIWLFHLVGFVKVNLVQFIHLFLIYIICFFRKNEQIKVYGDVCCQHGEVGSLSMLLLLELEPMDDSAIKSIEDKNNVAVNASETSVGPTEAARFHHVLLDYHVLLPSQLIVVFKMIDLVFYRILKLHLQLLSI